LRRFAHARNRGFIGTHGHGEQIRFHGEERDSARGHAAGHSAHTVPASAALFAAVGFEALTVELSSRREADAPRDERDKGVREVAAVIEGCLIHEGIVLGLFYNNRTGEEVEYAASPQSGEID